MAREFNVNFNNVEMTEGMDNLLENTQITKVKFTGDNDLKSLKSTFKDCPNLTTIEGDVNLNEVVEIDCMLEGVKPLEINLANINKLESVDNALTTAQSIIIKGDTYKKEALQNLLASLDWLSEQYTFEGKVGENVYLDNETVLGGNEVYIENSLELRNVGLEILGETYNNQLRDGDVTNSLKDWEEVKIEENINEITMGKMDTFVLEEIKGNTYQNLIEKNISNLLVEKKEYTINDGTTIFLKEDERKMFNITEIKGKTIKNLNSTKNKTFKTVPLWSKEITSEDNSFTIDQPIVEITEIWGQTENIDGTLQSVGELYIDKNGDPILDENGDFQYLLEIKVNEEDIISILLPQPLRSTENTRDRIYWDYEEECYYLEKKVDGEDLIKLLKLNNKIQLKTQAITNINVNSKVYPKKIILTNKQSVVSVPELNSNTQYSIHLKILGNTEENTITSSDLSLLSWTLGDYFNMSSNDTTLSNVISINANKGATNASCSIDFSKLFDTLTTNNFQFSCDFKVNSLSSNNDKSIIIQGGYRNEGFEVKGDILNTVTGHLTVTYNYSSKTYSIISTGAIPINVENVPFENMDIKNSFKIIAKNCNITYSNISLTTDNGTCIGEGEDKIPVSASLKIDLGGSSAIIKPTFVNGYSEYIIPITTSTLLSNCLELTGNRIWAKDIMVLKGRHDAYQKYFEGTKEIGEYKDDEYILILISNNYEEDWDSL